MKGSDAARQLKAIAALIAARADVSVEEIVQLLDLGLARPLASKSSTLSEVRSAAGRRGGARSVEVRREVFGSAVPPKQTPKQTEASPEAKLEANPEAKQAVGTPSLAPSLHPPPLPSPQNSELSSSSKTVQVTREAEAVEANSRSKTLEAKLPCPLDLELTADQRGSLLTSMIAPAHIDAVTIGYRAKYAGDTSELRTLGAWRRGLVTTIQSKWNDPRSRVLVSPDAPTPRRPAPIIQREARPIELGQMPPEIAAKISPPRPLLRPVKSREEQLAELRALDETAPAGRVEPEAAGG